MEDKERRKEQKEEKKRGKERDRVEFLTTLRGYRRDRK